jgi:hypothetical protein
MRLIRAVVGVGSCRRGNAGAEKDTAQQQQRAGWPGLARQECKSGESAVPKDEQADTAMLVSMRVPHDLGQCVQVSVSPLVPVCGRGQGEPATLSLDRQTAPGPSTAPRSMRGAGCGRRALGTGGAGTGRGVSRGAVRARRGGCAHERAAAAGALVGARWDPGGIVGALVLRGPAASAGSHSARG